MSLRFHVNMPDPRAAVTEEDKSDIPSGLIPNHKQSMALFLERVYGISEDRELFFDLLENAFLPDLRTATMLEKVKFLTHQAMAEWAVIALAMVCTSVLPSEKDKRPTTDTMSEKNENLLAVAWWVILNSVDFCKPCMYSIFTILFVDRRRV